MTISMTSRLRSKKQECTKIVKTWHTICKGYAMTNSAIKIMSKKEKNIKIEGEELELNNEETTQNDAETQAEEANGEETPTEKELDPLAAAQNDAEQWKDKYIRLVAEFDNYKKRTLKEKSELILNGSEKTVAAILPILDDFERATAD